MYDLKEEILIFEKGCEILGALDEAGRGPLAGPVVAACVILKRGKALDDKKKKLINDSKKLSAEKREVTFKIIYELFDGVGVGICDHKTIDRINILQASFLAMKKAMGQIKQKPDFIIVDGKFPIPNISTPQKPIIRGDETIFSIAAASIIAKVFRDRLMLEMHQKYPQYEFNKHKGYGTKLHLEKLKHYGPCEIHRKSFDPIKKLLKTKKLSII